ncbi:N2,N2-dimethylguanosine tRNA methyltransferase, putative [Plasmodium knowlesi strain H]|uniref:tRNA (guanine(26)-N(2))-dimethyltransferase n=3 Tax=Plasmodium knowlesi TaxID=5850 RepID=A0A5K1U2T2_PLAKH|nr:tRNA (guanine(26)-N(2))-dimethyltransferase, putative [Plasmodium knowlesi strain H]OTN64273.1 putative N2 - N2-dimethylguanosine tRNA methyltransferase [Plasmodium knowlesi]CAA9990801.1 tRNA (guanine(26)-N(2))-dimethyltransferase, putative [Plasmodium knowlesi strain H]SBO21046.1 N2,N2-dimethylguanosine tRNA methyltransferase, putative [Plasmodium knowlesi strain H]SBO21533.1 N2,N2-dimethylguanosine tRNA methyltransferase, putative [Plasmodium knowlesi strain H]VVS80275.1 tRNA (guanine(26)|eukprot:XP_002262089.1 N2,N2-dimethylguanosine tRNA methyltransferase,putative [Plasmodium knowlesi strain H]
MIGIKNEVNSNDKRKRKFDGENRNHFHNKYNKPNKGNNIGNYGKKNGREVEGGGSSFYNENSKYIFEGSVKIKNKSKHIFYNKAQVFNRDMSIILIKALEIYLKNKNKDNGKILFRGFNIIELLSASGIRSIRYVKELGETINHIITNDIDKYACKQIRRNFKRNNINKEKYTILCNDANSVMNILNVDNIYSKKRNTKKLDIGFTYVNSITDYNDYFKEAFKFLKYISNYNRGKGNNEVKEGMNVDNPSHNNNGNKSCNNGRSNVGTKNKSIEDDHHLEDSDSTVFSSNEESSTKIDMLHEENDKTVYAKGASTTQARNGPAKATINGGTDNEANHTETIPSGGKKNGGENPPLSESMMDEIIQRSKLSEKYMFDIIDIDPYGSSIDYLESCLKYGRSNFFILITNTDMRVLNGKFPDVSFYKYNSMIFSKRVPYNKEYSIRVLFYKIKTIASKYKKCVIPFSSLNIDFYIRILVQVIDDTLQTKDLCTDSGMVYQCNSCSSFHVNPLATKKDRNLSVTDNRKYNKKWKQNKHKDGEFLNNQMEEEKEDSQIAGNIPDAQLDHLHDANKNSYEKGKFASENFAHDATHGDTVDNVEDGVNTVDKVPCDNVVEKGGNCEQLTNGDEGGDVENVAHSECTENAAVDVMTGVPSPKDQPMQNNPGLGNKYKSGKLTISNKCLECGGEMLIGGPIYIGKMHNAEFINTCISLLENLQNYNLNTIKSRDRILINFRCLKQEINIPLYYNLPDLFRNFRLCSISRKLFVNALLNLNYEVSYFHKDPDSIKTNAPNSVFMDIFRAIIYKVNSKKRNRDTVEKKEEELNALDNKKKEGTEESSKKVYSINTIKDEKLKEKLLSYEFFKKNSTIDNIDISVNNKENTDNVKLFTLMNPEPFWGPMKKHYEKN